MEASIGQNIRKNREANSLSQKDLANQLFVTPQAISRWENDEVEPSLETIKKMAGIFKISLDELMGNMITNEASPLTPVKEEKATEAIQEETHPSVIGKCSICQKDILQGETKYYKTQVTKVYSSGHGRHHEVTEVKFGTNPSADGNSQLICPDCFKTNQKKLEEAKEKELLEAKLARQAKKRKAFGWSIFAGLASIIISLLSFFLNAVNPQASYIALVLFLSLLIGYAFFSVFFVLIADNTWISDFFFDTSLNGIVKAPAVIFNLGDGADGLIAFIILKVILAAMVFLLAVGFFLLSFALTAFFSMFGFPSSLKKLSQ